MELDVHTQNEMAVTIISQYLTKQDNNLNSSLIDNIGMVFMSGKRKFNASPTHCDSRPSMFS